MPIIINGKKYGMAAVGKGGGGTDPRVEQLLAGNGGVLDIHDIPVETLPSYAIRTNSNFDKVIFPDTLVDWDPGIAYATSINTIDLGGCTRMEGEKRFSIVNIGGVKELILPNSVRRVNKIEYGGNLERVSFRGKMVGDIQFYRTFHDLFKMEHFYVEANGDVILDNVSFTNNTSLLDVILSADNRIWEYSVIGPGNFANCPNLYKIVLDSPKIDLNLPALFYREGNSRYLELYMPSINNVIDITETFYNIDELNVFVPYNTLDGFKNHAIWSQYNIGITDPDDFESVLFDINVDKNVITYRGGDIIVGNATINEKQYKNGEEITTIHKRNVYPKQNEEITPNLGDSPRTLNITFGENRFPYSITQKSRSYTYHLRFKVDSTSDEQRFKSRIIPLNVFHNIDWSIYNDNGDYVGKVEEFKIGDGEWVKTKDWETIIEDVREKGGDVYYTAYNMNCMAYIAPGDGEYDIHLRLRNDELRGSMNGDNRFYTMQYFSGYGLVFDVINKEIVNPNDFGYSESNRNITFFEIGEDLNLETDSMVWDNYAYNGMFGGESEGSPMKTFILRAFNKDHHDNQILGHQDLENCIVYQHPNFGGGSLGYERLCGWGTNCVNLVFPDITKEMYVNDYWFEGDIQHIYVPESMVNVCKSWQHQCWQRNQEIIEAIPDDFSF